MNTKPVHDHDSFEACPYCGEETSHGDVEYCDGCETVVEGSTEQRTYCDACGESTLSDDKDCYHCGAPIA